VKYLKTFECCIPMAPQAKGNSRQFGRTWAGKPISRKSDKARAFMDVAILTIKSAANGRMFHPQSELRLECSVGYPTRHSDLDTSLVADALERAGVIDNDVQIGQKREVRGHLLNDFVNVWVTDVGTLPWVRIRDGKPIQARKESRP